MTTAEQRTALLEILTTTLETLAPLSDDITDEEQDVIDKLRYQAQWLASMQSERN
jgi:hypothetical protein